VEQRKTTSDRDEGLPGAYWGDEVRSVTGRNWNRGRRRKDPLKWGHKGEKVVCPAQKKRGRIS